MAKKLSKKRMLLAASVAGLLTLGGVVSGVGTAYADVNCAGVNACKGTGDCGGANHGCAGKNGCKGQGWLTFPTEELCTKVGGSVLPAA